MKKLVAVIFVVMIISPFCMCMKQKTKKGIKGDQSIKKRERKKEQKEKVCEDEDMVKVLDEALNRCKQALEKKFSKRELKFVFEKCFCSENKKFFAKILKALRDNFSQGRISRGLLFSESCLGRVVEHFLNTLHKKYYIPKKDLKMFFELELERVKQEKMYSEKVFFPLSEAASFLQNFILLSCLKYYSQHGST
ncbi:MAG: hypothetical protein V1855_01890 [bacterium]